MEFLCLMFINSRWYLSHKPFRDPLEDAAWRKQFAQRWNLPEVTPSMPGFARLPAFREFMFQAALPLTDGQPVPGEALYTLNQILREGTPQTQIIRQGEGYRLETLQQTGPIPWVQYQIARSFAALLTDYPLACLHQCANPDCDWIFYDSSKNHTRKWCDQKCASLMKVRRYRQKQRVKE